MSSKSLEETIQQHLQMGTNTKELTSAIREYALENWVLDGKIGVCIDRTKMSESISSVFEDWLSSFESRLTPDEVDELTEMITDSIIGFYKPIVQWVHNQVIDQFRKNIGELDE